MAKVVYGPVIGGARGKVTNIVYSRNRSGDYTRAYVSQRNANTLRQQAWRAKAGPILKAWKALTPAQRVAWSQAATADTRTNTLGLPKNLDGFHFFGSVNLNLAAIGIAMLTTPPPPAPSSTVAATLAVTAASVSAATLTLTWSPNLGITYTAVLQSTGSFTPSHTYIQRKLVQFATAPGPATTGNFFSQYSATFGAPVAGQVAWVSIKFTNQKTGQTHKALVAQFTWGA